MAIPLFGDDGVSVKDCTNAIHANRRLGNCIGRGRKILDRFEKLAQVRQVNRQGADRHNPGQDQIGPTPQNYGSANGDGNRDYRRQQRLDAACFEGGIHGGVADLPKLLFFHILTTEGLYSLHGFQSLLYDSDDVGLLLPDLVCSFFHGLLEP